MQIHVQSSSLRKISVSSALDNRRRNSFRVQTLELWGWGGGRLNHLFPYEAVSSSLMSSLLCRSCHRTRNPISPVSFSEANFPSHKTSPVNAAFLRANSVCIPFRSHLWETDKTICQITLAEGCSSSRSRTHGGPRHSLRGFTSRRRR